MGNGNGNGTGRLCTWAAFRASLEEIKDSTLMIHVVDISSPLAGAQVAAVEAGGGREREGEGSSVYSRRSFVHSHYINRPMNGPMDP